MWYQFKTYIYFLFTSKNQHGIHSPFVYQLITKCFYDKSNYPAYTIWQSVQQAYFKSKQILEMDDVGAGSHVFKSQKRSIAAVAKNAGTSFKRAKLLYRIAKYFSVKSALELGTSLGLGSIALSLNKNLHLTTVEACKNTIEIANSSAESLALHHIHFVNSTFDTYLETISPTQKFDLIFVDGHHQKEATLGYFEKLLTHVHNDSVMIFDDIYWNKSMTEAWQKMKKHPSVKVSIDTYFWGILFFRKEQAKEHFKIRV